MITARKLVVGLLTFLCAATLVAGLAPRAKADDDDPPSRVARLAYAQGSVSFQPAGTEDWVTARLNRPITTGDKLWSDNDSRTELQLDGSLIRLSSNTGFSFLNLSDNVTQIQLTAGTLLVRVRRLDESETYEIDTPNLAFSVLRPGVYRVSVNEAGDSTAIRIRSGEGEVTGGGAAYTVRSNDFVAFSGTDQLSAESEGNGYSEDQFDSWAATRDRHYENSSSSRYVSADVVGYEDLDDHGAWRRTPDNGYVWFPRTTEQGWAPYHNGHWDYIEPWGYTWVDDEPWGFAPFHYGRWVNYEGSWGWVPAAPRAEGVVYVRPVYAPALVAWVGGPHFAIGIGVGGGESYGSGVNVGWFPLGPREVYVPSYRVSRNYVNNVNVSNTTVNTTVVNNYYNTTVVNNNVSVTNVKYVNQSVPGAVAATTPQAFTSAQPVARNAVKVDQREVASAPVRAFTPPAVPAKQAVLGTGAAAAKPPAAIQTRAVVAKVAPPPPPPTFEKQQEAIKNNGGKPLSVTQVKQIQPAPALAAAAAKVKVAPPAAPKPVAAAPKPAQTNRPGQPQNGQPPQSNRPAPATNTPQTVEPSPTHPPDRSVTPETAKPAETKPAPSPNHPPDRPATPETPKPTETRPATAPPNRPPDRPATPPNAPQPANRPPASVVHPGEAPPPPRPVVPPTTNAELDRKHQQEQDQLHAKQLQERQAIQQQQEQEHAKAAQQQADAAKKQQLEQQHQQQTQQLLQKHADEQKALQQKQQQERQRAQAKPKKEPPPKP
jgi:FecR protein